MMFTMEWSHHVALDAFCIHAREELWWLFSFQVNL